MRTCTVAIIIVLSLAAGSLARLAGQAGPDKKTDADRVVGTWRIIKASQGGNELPNEQVQFLRLTFEKGGSFGIKLLEFDTEIKNNSYSLPAAGQIDLSLAKASSPGIYKFDGDDRLSICFDGGDGRMRPTKFTTEIGTNQVLFVLERTKPGEKFTAEELAAAQKAVETVRQAAARTQSAANLRQIAVAMIEYEVDKRHLPLHAVYDKDGKMPLLSWRVTLLPYFEEQALYKQFKLDEPWDSEHNKKLIPKMPKVYEAVLADKKQDGKTFYQVFTGADTVFDGTKKMKLSGITDGTFNTFLVIEAKEPVIWTKPADLALPKENAKMPALGGMFKDRVMFALCDASVNSAHNVQDPAILRALVTPIGGEPVSTDDLKQ